MIHHWSIARRLFVAHLLFMLALTAVVGTATFVDARDHAYEEAGRRMAGIATAVADNPLVLQAASASGSLGAAAALRPGGDAGRRTRTSSPIMAPDRTRWTHPRGEELGKPYIGSIDAALQGARCSPRSQAGTLGPSVRTIAPVKDADGKVRALVAAGVTVRTVDVAFSGRLPALLAIAVALLAGGSAGVVAAGPLPPPGDPRLGAGAAGAALRLLRVGAALGPRGTDPHRHRAARW